MKPLAILLLSACACLGQTANVTLTWDCPAPASISISWNVYQSSGINPPVWTLLTNVQSMSVTLPVEKRQQFFIVTTLDPQNFWKESDPCPPAAIKDDPPVSPQNITIKRADGGPLSVKKLASPKQKK